MMLAAFNAEPIHELKPRDKSKIESLLAYGDRLLVGLSSGVLRIYRVNELGAKKSVELLREEEKFSKKPVQQLAVVKEANLLVSLSDGSVALHDLQTFALAERLDVTRGATCFAVISSVVKDGETGVPSLVSRLAVGVKKKVLLWTWRDMELEDEVATVGIEAVAKSLTWITGSRLVVGLDPGFVLWQVESRQPTPIFKTGGESSGARFGAVNSSGMGYVAMVSWVPKPMATCLTENQILLAKDVNTLFIDTEGKALEKKQVPWASAPEAVGYSYPYLLALLSSERGTLQVRNPDTLSLLQSISVPGATILHVPQPNISLAHAGKGFLVASDRTIWRMNALPYDEQLHELINQRRFDEAISLLGLLEDTLIDDKQAMIREFKTLKAEDRFHQQQYRLALDLFTDAESPPARVIALYPRSVAGDLTTIHEVSDQSDAEPAAAGHECPHAEDEIASKEAPATPSKGVLSKLRVTASNGLRDPDSTSTRVASPARADSDTAGSRTPSVKPASKPLEGEDLKLAARCLTSFLAQARVKIKKFLSTEGTLKESQISMDPETGRPAFANLLPGSLFDDSSDLSGIDLGSELLKTAQLVDTTLFRAYMLASPSLAGPLFRLDNFCDPDVVRTSLYESDRYCDLIDFLHGKKLHRQALEVLAKFGKGEAEHADVIPENMKGPRRTVAYLKQLPPELVDLIIEFARWPLEEVAELGMEVFVDDSGYSEHLPRDKVLHLLKSMDEDLELKYLEHVTSEWNDQTPEFHQRLVDILIHKLKSQDQQSDTYPDVQIKLEAFLKESQQYNEKATLQQLPTDEPRFYESRAIVFGAMGKHKEALSIYVYSVKDYAKAEEYCNQTFLSQQQQRQQSTDGATINQQPTPVFGNAFASNKKGSQSNVFATLLGLYLKPSSGQEKRWPQALGLLSRHGARLPTSSTLELMPDDLAIADLQSYFIGRKRNVVSITREMEMVKALQGLQQINADRRLLIGPDATVEEGRRGGRDRRIRITEDDHCKLCHKRFGASAVRIYPDDTVVHYGCVGKKPSNIRYGWRRG
ncbi:hypothetical protein K470DRAFT_258940 [Piedraia hortae CBS 480.64]|uniref:CNH domain-containing protein n=1 Tax=Piedraia hortae CBS 480.64 TaxID=1314780 RepID=A0A6A7BW65_9PEZI|nr:hypothetical protein K470DRAFT_258940 [Piedraia hortae CBS 480.64]